MNYSFRNMAIWPRALTKSRQSARFDSTLSQTYDLLEREIKGLGGKNIRIGVACDAFTRTGEPQIRQMRHPGVVVEFDSRFGDKTFIADKYTDWRDNLRAVALTLERLRDIERWGTITEAGEQYVGFPALPASGVPVSDVPAPAPNETFASREMAAAWVAQCTNCSATLILNDPSARDAALKRGAKLLHPDAGGDAADFRRLKNAEAMLK